MSFIESMLVPIIGVLDTTYEGLVLLPMWGQLLLMAVFGLIIGSFLNVVILRYPQMLIRDWETEIADYANQGVSHSTNKGSEDREAKTADQSANDVTPRLSLSTPASHCPTCYQPLRFWHNIPLISWLLLRGQCSYCHTPISWRYPTIELVTALLGCIVLVYGNAGWPLVGMLILTWSLLTLSVIDIDHQLLPDGMTLPLLWLGIGFNYFGIFTSLENAVLGAALGYGLLWSVYWLFKGITGKEGMGFGDFKLLAALGAWLGADALPLIIILSSFSGAMLGIAMIVLLGRDRQLPIPFGPYLAMGGLIAALWGDSIYYWYLT